MRKRLKKKLLTRQTRPAAKPYKPPASSMSPFGYSFDHDFLQAFDDLWEESGSDTALSKPPPQSRSLD